MFATLQLGLPDQDPRDSDSGGGDSLRLWDGCEFCRFNVVRRGPVASVVIRSTDCDESILGNDDDWHACFRICGFIGCGHCAAEA